MNTSSALINRAVAYTLGQVGYPDVPVLVLFSHPTFLEWLSVLCLIV